MQYAAGILAVALVAGLWVAHFIGSKVPEKPVQKTVQQPALAEPVRRQIASQPADAVDIKGRGAAAILARSRIARAQAISKPLPGISYHVVRQHDRALAVVVRKHGIDATDRILKLFGANDGVEAHTERDRLEFQVEAA